MEFFSTTFCGAKITKGGALPGKSKGKGPAQRPTKDCPVPVININYSDADKTKIETWKIHSENDTILNLTLEDEDKLELFIYSLYADIFHDLKNSIQKNE